MRTTCGLLIAFCITASIVGLNLLEGQNLNEEQVVKLLREFVALEPDEVPGFDTKEGIVTRWPTGKGFSLLQRLFRQIKRMPGKEHTDILIRVSLASDRDIAYQAAISETISQVRYPDGAGMPEGSWTGFPIGEKSWATAPKAKAPGPGLGVANLVVWDGRLALRVIVQYQPIDPKARTAIFLPVDEEDLELGELAARLILAKANLVLIGWQELPKLRLVASGASLEARKVKEGTFLIPAQAVIERMGEKVERKLGVVFCSWRGREITLPIGARELLIGSWEVKEAGGANRVAAKRVVKVTRIPLSLPILFDGREVWVEGVGLAKGLGIRVERRGQTIALLP